LGQAKHFKNGLTILGNVLSIKPELSFSDGLIKLEGISRDPKKAK
jgi:fatty acid-binding protein DegV